MSRAARLLIAFLFACGGSPRRASSPTETRGLGEPAPAIEQRNVESRIVTIRIAFRAGSADDRPGREGLTRLAGRLMAEGGTQELTYTELVRKLYPMAGAISVQVGRDQTVFIGRVHRERLAEFYPLLRDVLLKPRMSEEDFRRLREEAKAALTLELRGGDDELLGKQVLQSMLYAGHPYGHPEVGTERSLDALELGAVRAQRKLVFCTGRAMLGVSGGYPEGFAQEVARDLERLPRCGALPARLPEPRLSDGRQALLIDKPEAQSTAISLGMAVDVRPGHPDYPALAFAFAYLGQHRQFGGVLFRKMRAERGLNYGDYAYADHFEQDGWSRFPLPNLARRRQYVSIWIRPVATEHAHFALRAAVRELVTLVERGVREPEFAATKTFLDRYYQLYQQTESRRLGFSLDSLYYGMRGRGSLVDQLRVAWRSLDRAHVREALQRHIGSERLAIAMVTPRAGQLAEALARDEPSPISYESPKRDSILAEDREIAAYPLRLARERIRIMPVAEVFQ